MDIYVRYLIAAIEQALVFLPDLTGEDDFDTPIEALYGRAILEEAIRQINLALSLCEFERGA